MKLCCNKCKKILTTDLRPVKVQWDKWGYIVNKYDVFHKKSSKWYDPEGDSHEYYEAGNMKGGIFYETKKEHYNHTPEDSGIDGYYKVIKKDSKIVVSGTSVLEDIIPPFKDGWGCCNWSLGKSLECGCGNTLGEMYLDCYEDYSILFNKKSTERVYKK